MYRYTSNKDLVDCAVIKVESESDYYYKVSSNNVMEASLLIKELFDKYNIPYERIYLMGFSLVTKGEIWSNERIFENISKEFGTSQETNKVGRR